MFRVGFACDIDGDNPTALLSDDDLMVTNMYVPYSYELSGSQSNTVNRTVDDRGYYIKAFKALMANTPGLRAFLEAQDDPSAVQAVISMVSHYTQTLNTYIKVTIRWMPCPVMLARTTPVASSK